jgi:hypothetical protein
LRLESFGAVPGKRIRLIGTLEKLTFNIGRILAKQSREPLLRACGGQILPPGRKGIPAAVPQFPLKAIKLLK